MADFLEVELKAFGATVRKVSPGDNIPPIILAQVGNDPSKKTILCYGHYDVQPVRRFSLSFIRRSLTSESV